MPAAKAKVAADASAPAAKAKAVASAPAQAANAEAKAGARAPARWTRAQTAKVTAGALTPSVAERNEAHLNALHRMRRTGPLGTRSGRRDAG